MSGSSQVFDEGYQIGHDEGWAQGKRKAFEEIRSVMRSMRHASGCGCEPCLILREHQDILWKELTP